MRYFTGLIRTIAAHWKARSASTQLPHSMVSAEPAAPTHSFYAGDVLLSIGKLSS